MYMLGERVIIVWLLSCSVCMHVCGGGGGGESDYRLAAQLP